jgi:membrane-associated phospholipid phosphatase
MMEKFKSISKLKNAHLIITLLLSFVTTINSFAQVADTTRITDTSTISINRTKFKTFIPGIAAFSYGLVALSGGPLEDLDRDIARRRNEKRPNFSSKADDYLRYVPFVALYGLDALGIKGKHNLKEKTTLVLVTGVVAYGSLNILKNISDKERPNHTNSKSFPSGHATVAFTGAEIFNQEYGDLSPWYSIAGYTVASATAVLRVYNNDHWFSDVVAGAGLGILSTKLVYVAYPHLKKLFKGEKKGLDFTAVPIYQDKTFGVSFSGKF